MPPLRAVATTKRCSHRHGIQAWPVRLNVPYQVLRFQVDPSADDARTLRLSPYDGLMTLVSPTPEQSRPGRLP